MPGNCQVLIDGKRDSAACALREIGKPAVPALMALLNDERPTRSIAGGMNGNYVLRYCDASVQIIDAIACRQFDDVKGTGQYFGNADIETKKRIITEVKNWWDKSKDKTEAEWIREALTEKKIGSYWLTIDGAKRLIALEGSKSAEFFREHLKKEPDDPWAISLLWEAGGKAVLEDIRPFLTSENRHVRLAAYRAFVETGDKDVVKTVIKELDSVLSKPVENPFHYRDPIAILVWSEDEIGILSAARLLLHKDPGVADSAGFSFQAALRRNNKPSKELRRIVFPYMAAALDNEGSKYWALYWFINTSETGVEVPLHATDEQRDKAIEQLKQWWAEHKSEYPEILK